MKKIRRAKPKVAFIFSQFPCYDEVFIIRELVALDRLLDLRILSLKSSRRDPVRHRTTTPLLTKTIYAPLMGPKIAASNLIAFARRPRRYLRALWEVIRLNCRDAEFFAKSVGLFPQAVSFAGICARLGIEHVHGQWATYPATSALVVSILNDIPFSFTGHAHDIHVKTTGLRQKIERAAFVLTCTRHNQGHLLRLAPGIDPSRIRVVYHGVDLSGYRFRPVTPAPIAGSGRPPPFRIVSVGSLFECKGFEYLIEACRILRERGLDFRCRIIGGGYLMEKLQAMVSQRRLTALVEFTGYQPQEAMAGHYAWADLCVLPAVLAIHWGIPNVLLESLAVGVPVACTPLPSLPELISDPPCGFVIPEKDPEAVADLVMRLDRERDILVQYGRAGRAKIERFWDVENTARLIARMFQTET